MAVFKCKMCGGDLDVTEGQKVVDCRYCGTSQTLPRLDNERRINLYDRANHFRRNAEFDKAAGIYEQILEEDPEDAEAYWSRVLCRFGIDYVEDPATHKRIPTVNRMQPTSIYDDEDYKEALAKADSSQRSIYEDEAKAIADIQKSILEISSKEAPFDVFICYKETDSQGRRTQDSVLANDLYHQLVQEGFKVFFSRITLEDKLGTAYEPYIFAALNSAKAMVVLGTRPEHFQAVWVRNEWSRYLGLIKSGAKKTLIPAYRDMDPYDLPEEFSHLQAQDMSKLGFMQDLVRGIRKIVGDADKKQAATVVVQNAGGSTDQAALLKRAYMFLEDGDWAQAKSYCERVLDADPESAEAYLGELMAELHVRKRENLKDVDKPFDNNDECVKACRFGDEAIRSELEDANAHIKERNEAARLDALYAKAEELEKAGTDFYLENAIKAYHALGDYKDADDRVKAVRLKLDTRKKQEAAKKKKIIRIAGITLAVVAAIIAIVLVVTLVVLPAQEKARVDAAKVSNGALQTAKVGDYVYLGTYEQDNNTSNGKEDIEWRVLAIEDGKVLLVSKYGLDCKQFNSSKSKGNVWESSDLKSWLQGTFASNAGLSDYKSVLTCLSIDEANKYFSSYDDRKCVPTAYAVAQGVYQSDEKKVDGVGTCHWWLRSAGGSSYRAARVGTDGDVGSYGYDVTDDNRAVRPALWINL